MLTAANLDDFYMRMVRVPRSEINARLFARVPKDARVLEVGASGGNQLQSLWEAGYTELYGVEINPVAVRMVKGARPELQVLQGSIYDLPFKDGYFDAVFTSGVLIHIPPDDLPRAMAELVRCSKRYVIGGEYYKAELTELNWKGEKAKRMWAGPYRQVYMDTFPGLRLVHEESHPLFNVLTGQPDADRGEFAFFSLEKADQEKEQPA
jgi:pseudaminic acid biosynthesis-associated methylase